MGRKLHLVTDDSAVIDYLLNQSNTQVSASGTFTLFDDDTSVLGANPNSWFDGYWGTSHQPAD